MHGTRALERGERGIHCGPFCRSRYLPIMTAAGTSAPHKGL
jgi:hypothetical protein